MEIEAHAPNESTLRRALAAGFGAIGQAQRLLNRHDRASEVSLLNRAAARAPIAVHDWTRTVLRAARKFSHASAGAFDITLEGGWSGVVIGRDGRVRFRRPLTLDLGGIAKGFAVDRAVEALRGAGACAGIVNAGGDLRVFGADPQSVQVRHPLDPGRRAGTILLRERALATSALYFAPALFDGRTGQPVTEEISVTVGAADCLTADALTKAALVLREAAQPLLARFGADAFLLQRQLPPRWLSRTHAPQLDQT